LPRNFFRRVELAFPIEDGVLRERIVSEILAVSLADNVKARFLAGDGTYRAAKLLNGENPRRSQVEFMELAAVSPGRTRKSRSARAEFPEVKLAKRPF
jgi:polyphosphate kinase